MTPTEGYSDRVGFGDIIGNNAIYRFGMLMNVVENADVRLCVEGVFFENEVMWIQIIL